MKFLDRHIGKIMACMLALFALAAVVGVQQTRETRDALQQLGFAGVSFNDIRVAIHRDTYRAIGCVATSGVGGRVLLQSQKDPTKFAAQGDCESITIGKMYKMGHPHRRLIQIS